MGICHIILHTGPKAYTISSLLTWWEQPFWLPQLATAQNLISNDKQPVVVHSCASTTNPIRHIRLVDDVARTFWTKYPPKFRCSFYYPKSSDYLTYLKEGSLLFSALMIYDTMKFTLFALLLRCMGQPDLAQKLWQGWLAWKTYNSERLDVQLFFCSRNARYLQSILVPEDRLALQLVWLPEDDWVAYGYAHQHSIQKRFFGSKL
eukprot:jgi/Botrbrau1/22085/Bobra.0206s0012.1